MLWRWLLAPLTQWRARRLMMRHGPTLDAETAWNLVSLAQDPAALPYVRLSQNREGGKLQGGVVTDAWSRITDGDRRRRLKWLQRHSETPLHRLGITEELIELAGLVVTEWSLPPGCRATSIVVQQRGRRPE